MQAQLVNVSSRYGAQMGRPSLIDPTATEGQAVIKFSLNRVRLNSGGYDSGGAYWGVGQALYFAAASREDTGALIAELYFRVKDRDAAKAHVRSKYPSAKFYR